MHDSRTKSFLSECLTPAQYAKREGYSVAWVYKQIQQGLPVLRTGERNGIKIHPPTADAHYKARLMSKRNPAKVARTKPRTS